MSIYAHISNGVVAELFTPPAGFTLAQCFTPAVAANFVDVTNNTPAVQAGDIVTQTNGVTTFAAPPAPIGPSIESQAQAALTAMDAPGGCAIRCFKAGVAFPANWQAYCTELRAIVNGTASPMPTTLPAAPAYPTGT